MLSFRKEVLFEVFRGLDFFGNDFLDFFGGNWVFDVLRGYKTSSIPNPPFSVLIPSTRTRVNMVKKVFRELPPKTTIIGKKAVVKIGTTKETKETNMKITRGKEKEESREKKKEEG